MTTEGEFFRSVVPEDAVPQHDFDTSVAHPARIWNVLLGGKDNFAAGRAVALNLRTKAGVTQRFSSTGLVPPGVVQLDRWPPGGPGPAIDPEA